METCGRIKESNTKMSLKVYYDLMSQPSRALLILLQSNKVPYEACPVALRKGEHLTDEFKQISRFQKVPVIDDKGFTLTESVAILRYLVKSRHLEDNWYPSDLKRQARVDEYLEWQHNNTRALCTMYFRVKWLEPILTGEEPNPSRVAGHEQRMSDCLDKLEQLWLAHSNFIAGDTISAADLWAACEVEQPRMAGYDPRKGRPILSAWLDRVQSTLSPYYANVHSVVNKLASKVAKPLAKL